MLGHRLGSFQETTTQNDIIHPFRKHVAEDFDLFSRVFSKGPHHSDDPCDPNQYMDPQ